MSITHQRGLQFHFLITAILFVCAFAASPAFAAATQFSGQATAVRATVLGLQPIVLSDTGPLPPEGGQQEATWFSANVPGVLNAELLHATTIGQGNRSRSEVSLANLELTAGGNSIGAAFLMSRASAVCDNNGSSSVSGNSEIAELTINGQTIAVSGEPNQTINLPLGGTVIINEQSGNSSDITVTALHVIVPGTADVAIATAHADVKCASNACDLAKDFITGGGWISPPNPKANFAVAGGIKNGSYWGHLEYIDHGSGMKVKGTGVTAYTFVDERTRHIEGKCEINGASGTYKVDVSDVSEPGHDADTFNISFSNGYMASGKLAGGNIQLHGKCR